MKNYRPWYGEGIYLYLDGISTGVESAQHYVSTIRKKPTCQVVKAEFEAERVLDFTKRDNFAFLLNVVIPQMAEQLGKLASIITPSFAIEYLTRLDPGIDGIKGASYEGESIGDPAQPHQGNLLLDVQSILCLTNPSVVKSIHLL